MDPTPTGYHHQFGPRGDGYSYPKLVRSTPPFLSRRRLVNLDIPTSSPGPAVSGGVNRKSALLTADPQAGPSSTGRTSVPRDQRGGSRRSDKVQSDAVVPPSVEFDTYHNNYRDELSPRSSRMNQKEVAQGQAGSLPQPATRGQSRKTPPTTAVAATDAAAREKKKNPSTPAIPRGSPFSIQEKKSNGPGPAGGVTTTASAAAKRLTVSIPEGSGGAGSVSACEPESTRGRARTPPVGRGLTPSTPAVASSSHLVRVESERSEGGWGGEGEGEGEGGGVTGGSGGLWTSRTNRLGYLSASGVRRLESLQEEEWQKSYDATTTSRASRTPRGQQRQQQEQRPRSPPPPTKEYVVWGARVGRHKDVLWQEHPSRLLKYRPSHLHDYGYIPFLIPRNLKATVMARPWLHMQTLILLGLCAAVHQTGFGADDEDIAAFVALLGNARMGSVLNMGQIVVFILALFITLVINRWWAVRTLYSKLHCAIIEVALLATSSCGLDTIDAPVHPSPAGGDMNFAVAPLSNLDVRSERDSITMSQQSPGKRTDHHQPLHFGRGGGGGGDEGDEGGGGGPARGTTGLGTQRPARASGDPLAPIPGAVPDELQRQANLSKTITPIRFVSSMPSASRWSDLVQEAAQDMDLLHPPLPVADASSSQHLSPPALSAAAAAVATAACSDGRGQGGQVGGGGKPARVPLPFSYGRGGNSPESLLVRWLNLSHVLTVTTADAQSRHFPRTHGFNWAVTKLVQKCGQAWPFFRRCCFPWVGGLRSKHGLRPSKAPLAKAARDIGFLDLYREGLVTVDEWNILERTEARGLPKYLLPLRWCLSLIQGASERRVWPHWSSFAEKNASQMHSRIALMVDSSSQISMYINSQIPYPYVWLVSLVVHFYLVVLTIWFGAFLRVGYAYAALETGTVVTPENEGAYAAGFFTITMCYLFIAFANLLFQGLLDIHSLLDNPFGRDPAKFPLRLQITSLLNTSQAFLAMQHNPESMRECFAAGNLGRVQQQQQQQEEEEEEEEEELPHDNAVPRGGPFFSRSPSSG